MGTTDDVIDHVLKHHGVKGMKWGVRKDAGHEGERAKTSKIAKLDSKFEKNSQSVKTTFAVYNKAAGAFNKEDLDRINNKPEYKNADFSKPSALRTKYYKEHQDAFVSQLEKAADSLGTNASGTRKYSISQADDGSWDIFTSDVKHADNSIKAKVTYSKTGHIIKVELPQQELTQEDRVDEFLQHHGIKGMKWGVRRSRAELEGASDDAKKAHAAKVQVKEAKGTHVLSNDELKSLVERMQLEQRYSQLSSQQKTMTAGQKFAKELLGDPAKGIAKQQITRIGNDLAAKKVDEILKANGLK